MKPTSDFLHQADKVIRQALDELAPQLLEAQGSIEHKLKPDNTAVTEMDVMVEQRLRDVLAKFDAGIGFGGEETGVDFDQQTFWLVDPIDGTAPFIRGLPFATNMLTLIHDGEPVMSIINNFTLQDYYLAIKSEGATCNGHPIHVSNRPANQAWVSLGITLGETQNDGITDAFARVVKAVRRFGGAGFEHSQIARGALDGRISFRGQGKEWDFAPGALLVQEAGGRVANIGSDHYNYRDLNLVAANPVIFDDLMRFVTSWK